MEPSLGQLRCDGASQDHTSATATVYILDTHTHKQSLLSTGKFAQTEFPLHRAGAAMYTYTHSWVGWVCTQEISDTDQPTPQTRESGPLSHWLSLRKELSKPMGSTKHSIQVPPH